MSSVGRRVVVTGLAGAGKSTFSKALAAKTGLSLIHLDLHFWKPGWVAPSDDEWRKKQRSVLAGDEWIADGNYHETLDLRLELGGHGRVPRHTVVDLRTARVRARLVPIWPSVLGPRPAVAFQALSTALQRIYPTIRHMGAHGDRSPRGPVRRVERRRGACDRRSAAAIPATELRLIDWGPEVCIDVASFPFREG